VATPISQIIVPVTFGTQENFQTMHMQFEVADFKMAHNASLERPTLTMFMAISHYAYLVMKMPGPNTVISIKGDDRESYDDKHASGIRRTPRVEESLG
jgi:hypothetical protein